MKKTIIPFLILFIISNYCLSKEPVKAIESKEIIEKDISNITYKMLYDNQVKANDAVLKTIFYALGGLGTAMLFVFGSNWWFNEKKVTDIKEGIKNQISGEINNLQIDLQKEITNSINQVNSLFNDFAEKHRTEAREDYKTLSENYQTQLKSFSDNINIQNSTIKTSTDERFELLQKTIEMNHNKMQTLFEETKKENETATKQLKLDVLHSEGSLWVVRGIYLNALRSYLHEGMLSIEIGWTFNLKYVFYYLIDVAPKLTYITTPELERCKTFISSINEEDYVDEKRKLMDIIEKVEVKD